MSPSAPRIAIVGPGAPRCPFRGLRGLGRRRRSAHAVEPRRACAGGCGEEVSAMSPSAPRIAIVGPGALGCLFGGLLALAGHDVRLLARRAEQAEQLARDGIVIEREGEE